MGILEFFLLEIISFVTTKHKKIKNELWLGRTRVNYRKTSRYTCDKSNVTNYMQVWITYQWATKYDLLYDSYSMDSILD